MSEKEVRFKIPAKVYEVLEDLCKIDIEGELTVEFDKVNQLARECLYRGLAQIIEEKSKVSVRTPSHESGELPTGGSVQ